MGGAAVGLPALVNALVSRRARKLPRIAWGTGSRYAWRHGEVLFQQLGDGLPVVLLHAFGPGHSSVEWRSAAEALATDHAVFAPDLLGWGRSARPDITYDGELYIRLLTDFLDDVVRQPATVVAAGLPAAYAVQVAADRPELVTHLGLIVPLGLGRGDDEPDLKDAVLHRLLRLPVIGTSALNLFTSRAALAGYLRREVYAAAERVDDTLIDEHYRTSHLPGANTALAAYLSGYLNHGVRDVLPRVAQRTWIAWGRHAASPAVESSDLWLRGLPNAEVDVLESCGALPHTESPAELARKLDHFLSYNTVTG